MSHHSKNNIIYRCDFCDKTHKEVRAMVGRDQEPGKPIRHICDECVGLIIGRFGDVHLDILREFRAKIDEIIGPDDNEVMKLAREIYIHNQTTLTDAFKFAEGFFKYLAKRRGK